MIKKTLQLRAVTIFSRNSTEQQDNDFLIRAVAYLESQPRT